jgi:uncharacterized membrane protein YfhO
MNWITILYALYFLILFLALGLYSENYQQEGAIVVGCVVVSHYLVGLTQWLSGNTTPSKRYKEWKNIAADLLLLAAAVFALLSILDPPKVEWYYSAFSLAFVGNIFCIWAHITAQKPKTVREWPMETE